MAGIPISAAEAFCKEHGLTQIVIFAYGENTSHIVTWADSAGSSAVLAEAANKIKASLGWPEITQVTSAKVVALEKEVCALREFLKQNT